MGQTHVHHLNYGIFLLCTVRRRSSLLSGQRARTVVVRGAYGFSLALTFDEFGMWLHLGGSYWQRASFDAVIVVASLFGMIAFAPPLARLSRASLDHRGITVIATIVFYLMLFKSLDYAGKRVGPRLEQLEQSGPQ